jgi:hypothetical protein
MHQRSLPSETKQKARDVLSAHVSMDTSKYEAIVVPEDLLDLKAEFPAFFNCIVLVWTVRG